MNKFFLTFTITLILLGLGYFLYNQQNKTSPTPPQIINRTIINNATNSAIATPSAEFKFETPKKSAHYESNSPSHSSILASVPINIVLDFNFDVSDKSDIQIEGPGKKDYGEGKTSIDPNKLTLRRKMMNSSPDGLYTVKYTACWPDGSCHNGFFQFAIDRQRGNSFTNMTDQKEVTIKLSQTKFKPENLKISKGTKVIWVNDDEVEHFVNTDSHPAHTYYLIQNSRALKKGETYSVTFDTPGIYPYHCSAHASSMTGNLLVE